MSKHVVRLGTQSIDLFINRLDKIADKHPIAKSVARLVGDSFLHHRQIDAYIAKAEKASNWQHLNEAGKLAERRKALSEPFIDYAKGRRAIQTYRNTLNSTLPKMKQHDKGDAVGELRDQELRAFVRSLPQEKRDSLQAMSPEVRQAVARAPAELSGLSPSVHRLLQTQIIEAERPDEIAAWRAADEALQVADDALNAVERDYKAAAEFKHDGEYREFVDTYVAPAVVGEKK